MSANKCIRAAVLLLCAAMLFSVPSACGPGSEKIKISVGFRYGASEQERQYYSECKAEFERRYPQYKLVSSPYVYDSRTIVSKYASGQLPVLFEADAAEALRALANGYVRDVSGYMDGFGWTEKADGFFLSEITSAYGVCGVPAQQYAAGMVLNLPLLARAGVIEEEAGGYVLYDDDGVPLWPDTFDEVEAAAAKVAETCGEGVFGVLLPSGDGECGGLYLDMAYNFGCGALERQQDGVYRLDLGSEGFGDAMRWVRRLAQERLADGFNSYGAEEWAAEMAAGRAAVTFCNSDDLAAALAAEPSLRGSLAFVPMPSSGESCSAWRGTVYAVSALAGDAQAEGAFRFLQFIGCGPDSDDAALSATERRLQAYISQGMPLLPCLPVWEDEDYLAGISGLYERYSDGGALYCDAFYRGFAQRRRHGEPFARRELCELMDELFSRMIFDATTSNIVTLLEESETAFTEKYLNR